MRYFESSFVDCAVSLTSCSAANKLNAVCSTAKLCVRREAKCSAIKFVQQYCTKTYDLAGFMSISENIRQKITYILIFLLILTSPDDF